MKYLIKYGLVGVIATFLHILCTIVFVYFYAMDIIYANWLAFSIAFFFSYAGNAKFVFEHKFQKNNFKRFLAVSAITLMIITFISYFGKVYQLEKYLIILIIGIMIPASTFVIHKTWTFRR